MTVPGSVPYLTGSNITDLEQHSERDRGITSFIYYNNLLMVNIAHSQAEFNNEYNM